MVMMVMITMTMMMMVSSIGFNVDVYEEYDKRRMILIKDEHFDSCDPDWRQVLEDYGGQGSEVLEEFLLLPS